MSLYEKYRPTSLKDFVGNASIKKDLLPFIRGTRPLPTAILLTGGSGMGKTTLARILSKGCNIQDLVELDVADFRGIDTIRDIRKQMHLSPLLGDRRGWILDEVHRCTSDAQAALLKALESPPAGVHFFLCTTDPQQLLKTVLTRCTQFEVQPLEDEELVRLLGRVCNAENVDVPEKILTQIAGQANGSSRAALSMLERVIGRPDADYEGQIDSFQEQETQVRQLCQALLKKRKWAEVANILKGIKQEPESVRYAVLGYMNAVLLSGKDVPQAAVVIESFKEPYFHTKAAGLTLSCYSSVL